MRKILIEIELEDSFDAYFENETDMVNSILTKPQENYKWRLVNNLNLQNVSNSGCQHDWDSGNNNVHRCKKCGKYSA